MVSCLLREPLNSTVKTKRCFFVSLDAPHPDLNIQAFGELLTSEAILQYCRMKLWEILALRLVKLFWAEICETLWNFQCLLVCNVKWHVVLASFLEWGYCVVVSKWNKYLFRITFFVCLIGVAYDVLLFQHFNLNLVLISLENVWGFNWKNQWSMYKIFEELCYDVARDSWFSS